MLKNKRAKPFSIESVRAGRRERDGTCAFELLNLFFENTEEAVS